MKFRTTIPDKVVGRDGAGLFVKNSVLIFTNGSKTGGNIGSRIFLKSIGIEESIRLPDYCRVFQAEVLAVQAAVKIFWYSNVPSGNISMHAYIIGHYNPSVRITA